MDAEHIIKYVLMNYSGVVLKSLWGEKALVYNPGDQLPNGTYFVFIKEKDTKNDKASNLDRDGVYRINLGIGKKTFLSLFKELPSKPPKGGVMKTGHNFQEFDRIMPHPVYGWAAWICVLNPSEENLQRLKPLLDEAYHLAKDRFEKRMKKKKEVR